MLSKPNHTLIKESMSGKIPRKTFNLLIIPLLTVADLIASARAVSIKKTNFTRFPWSCILSKSVYSIFITVTNKKLKADNDCVQVIDLFHIHRNIHNYLIS